MFREIRDTVLLARLKLNQFKEPKNVYQGPIIDAMAQTDSQISLEYIKDILDSNNITHMALFGRQQNPNDSTQHVIDIAEALGDKIILGSVKRFDQQDDLTPQFVKETVDSILKGPCHYVGEIMFAHADKYPSEVGNEVTLRGERYVNAIAPNVLSLMDQLDGKDIPVFVHWEIYHWDRDWPVISELFASYPDIKFIWPHAGYGKAVYANEVLNKHKNVYVTLSKRDLFHLKRKWRTFKGEDLGGYSMANVEWQDFLGSSMLEPSGEIYHQWLHLIQRYPDKFMFATDCHKVPRWKSYSKIISLWREILGQLPDDLAEMIAYKNAMFVFGIKK